MGSLTKTKIMPCGKCGKKAIAEEGIIATRHEAPPITYRCSDRNCLSGPVGPSLANAVHGWNRVSQGWIGMDVLTKLSQQIPELAPQIHAAMQSSFEKVAPLPVPPPNGKL